MFIVIEGIDGSGKTTQAQLLYAYLLKKGYKVHLTAEPSPHVTGNALKLLLRSKEKLPKGVLLLSFLADRITHTENTIKPLLKEGYIVISDRYHPSTLAYQRVEGFEERDINTVLKVLGASLPIPDVVIYIDVSPEVAMERMRRRSSRAIYEELEFLRQVRERYLSMKDIVVVNGERDPITIHKEVVSIVEKLLSSDR